MINYSIDDIDERTATAAFTATSWTPKRRGERWRKEYVEHLDSVVEEFEKWKTDDNAEEMAQDLQRYKEKYLQLTLDYLHTHSRCLSSFVTGPSNFPTRRAEKANKSAHKRLNELIDKPKKILKKLRAKYDPVRIANAPIRSDDDDAIEKLNKKIKHLEGYHETMKGVNKIIRRKNKTDNEKIQAIMDEFGFRHDTARQLLMPDFMNRVGFPSYSLSNNRAEINRLKKRVEELEREANREETEWDTPEGIQVEENQLENRFQIYFDEGKPPDDIRKLLKSCGFRFSWKNNAWQRLLNQNARIAFTYRVLPKLKETYQ